MHGLPRQVLDLSLSLSLSLSHDSLPFSRILLCIDALTVLMLQDLSCLRCRGVAAHWDRPLSRNRTDVFVEKPTTMVTPQNLLASAEQ